MIRQPIALGQQSATIQRLRLRSLAIGLILALFGILDISANALQQAPEPASAKIIHLSPNKPVDRYHVLNFFTGGKECESGGTALHPEVEPPWSEKPPDGRFFVHLCKSAGVWIALGPQSGTTYEITCHLTSKEDKQFFLWESIANPRSRKVLATAPAADGVISHRFVGTANMNERRFIIGSDAGDWIFTSCDISIKPR